MRPQYLRSPPGVETGGLFYGCSGVLVIYGKGLARQIARQPCNDFFIAHHPNIGLQIKTNGFAKVSGVIKRSGTAESCCWSLLSSSCNCLSVNTSARAYKSS